MRDCFVVESSRVLFVVIFVQFLAFERSRNGLPGSAESTESYGATNCILFTKYFQRTELQFERKC